jgi:hypothetical protein
LESGQLGREVTDEVWKPIKVDVLLPSVRVPPEFEIPPTAIAKALGPPGASALFPLTVLSRSVRLPPKVLRMPPTPF